MMAQSKFVMAQKLHDVQKSLMGKKINPHEFEETLRLIFEECSKENLTFWFNFYEDYCALNLRDVQHENYELNIRCAYVNVPTAPEEIIQNKIHLLQNTFLLIEEPVVGFQSPTTDSSGENSQGNYDELILTSDKPIPPHVNKAIDKIKAKGIPVTKESIKNHIPWGSISTDQRIKCTNFLNEMGAS